MMVAETIFFAIGLLLAVYGAADILWRMACRLVSFEREEHAYLLVPLSGERDDAEYQARRAKLLCRGGGVQPMLLDNGLTPNSAALAQAVCERLQIPFAAKKEWQELLQTALQDEKKGV